MAVYSLKYNFIARLFAVFAFFVHGASDVGTDSVSVSVIKGDSVTLHTNIRVNQQDRVKWYFIDTLIAQLNLSHICTDVQCLEYNERFRDRLKLDHQTGDLTITNISTSDAEVYQLKFFRIGSHIGNSFDVVVHDVPAAEMNRKSLMEGESVTLDTPEEKTTNDVMTWYFNDTLIAEITGDQTKICEDVHCKERFRDRLKLDHQTGSLTITKTRTTDSGDYKLQIKSSRNHYSTTSIKGFTVWPYGRNVKKNAVSDSGLSPDAIARICFAVCVLLVAAAAAGVIYYRCRSSRKDEESPHDLKGSQHRAGANGGLFHPLAESESETE